MAHLPWIRRFFHMNSSTRVALCSVSCHVTTFNLSNKTGTSLAYVAKPKMGSVLVAKSFEHSAHVPTTLLKPAKSSSSLASLDAPSKLRSNLYIGSKDTEQNLASLRAAGITHILQAGVELAPSHPPQQFRYQQLACSDTEEQDIVSMFHQAFEFIEAGRKQGVVLVHCAQGVSRSASILIGYLMSREQLTYSEALAQLQAVRPQVQPNPGFALQLQDFGAQGCCLDTWAGWDGARLEHCFAQVSVSRRREVNSLSAMIRHFHMADVGEEDTVFDARSFLL